VEESAAALGADAEVIADLVQAVDEAATKSVTVTLPSKVGPRPSALARACSAPDAATCPSSADVGTATATVPFLRQPITGRVVLLSRGIGSFSLAVLFSNPAIRLEGPAAITANGLTTTFNGIPDVPLTDLKVRFSGGPNSLLVSTAALCVGTSNTVGDFTAHSGKTARVTAPLAVSGCVLGRLAFSGLGGSTPAMALSVRTPQGAPALKTLEVALPSGLSIAPASATRARLPRGLSVRANGRLVRRGVRVGRHRLRIVLRRAARRLRVRLRAPALRVSRSLARSVRRHQAGRLAVRIKVRDTRGKTTRLRLSARAR
jgi:hypothetical protein